MFCRFILLLGLVGTLNISYAKYLPLVSKGDIPEAFKGKYYVPGLLAANQNLEEYFFENTAVGNDYHLSGMLMLRSLALSGDIIWGDPISQALQKEADEIAFKHDYKIKPKVYLYRSSSVNAFATYGSNIFFTTALVAQATNFYELVYILGHEMAHLKNKDSYYKYLDTKELIKKAKKPGLFFGRYRAAQEISDNISKHSKEKELVADRMGYAYLTELNYPEENAISALHTIEDSKKNPIFDLPISRGDSITLALPNFTVTRYDVRNFKKMVAEWSSTHPDFEVRYAALEALKSKKEGNLNRIAKVDFKALKKIAMNETLYAYYLNNQYYKIIAYYHLADKNLCDEEFLNYLYALSLYDLLKLKIAITETRAGYDPNKIIVEFGGPIGPWLEMYEPTTMNGPERPFISYINDITIVDLWYEASRALLSSNQEADYYYHPLLFDHCNSIYDSLADKSEANYSEKELSKMKDDINEVFQRISASYSLNNNSETIILLEGYSHSGSDDSPEKTDFDKIDEEFKEQLKILNQQLNRSTNLSTQINVVTTEEYNRYNAQRRLIRRRHEMSYLESYACFDPDETYNLGKNAEYISMESYDKGSEFYTSHLNFENGKIELSEKLQNKAKGNNWKKWNKMLLEFYNSL